MKIRSSISAWSNQGSKNPKMKNSPELSSLFSKLPIITRKNRQNFGAFENSSLQNFDLSFSPKLVLVYFSKDQGETPELQFQTESQKTELSLVEVEAAVCPRCQDAYPSIPDDHGHQVRISAVSRTQQQRPCFYIRVGLNFKL